MKRNHVVLPSALLVAFPLVLLGGCVEKSQELSSAEQEQLGEFVTNERPDPDNDLDIDFENKIELIGYDVEPETWTEGEAITVTWYWHAKQALEEGWLLFTHLADASGNNRLNSDGDSVVRRLYQPGRWKAGEYIVDRQTITLPEDWNSPKATFYLGVWNGPHRLRVTEGPNDGENRARAVQVDVEDTGASAGETPEPAVPTLRAKKTDADITIDGKLQEQAWAEAPSSSRFVNTMNGGAAEPNTTAKMLWDDENLYVAFTVADDFLKADLDERDAHLWEQDVVELMVDPDGDGEDYFEIQVAPNGQIFDTRYESRRQPQPYGHVDWNADIEAKVETRGELDDDEADEGYTVEMAIPWSAFSVGDDEVGAPSVNQVWRANLFVMDARQEGQRAAGWSPPRTGDFHVLERFGRVMFVDAAAQQAPQAQQVQAGKAPSISPEVLDRLRKRVGDRNDLAEAQNPATPREGEMMPERPTSPTMGGMAAPSAMTTAMGGSAGDEE